MDKMKNLELLTTFILDSPHADFYPLGTVIGIKGEGFQICNKCMIRIHQRGYDIPKPNKLLWIYEDRIYYCDLEQFHHVSTPEAA
jgi:hypothetical protein